MAGASTMHCGEGRRDGAGIKTTISITFAAELQISTLFQSDML